KEEREKRKSARLLWSPDGRHFIMTRKDNRTYTDLWVINNVGSKRPTLETYKYLMPGEADSSEVELHLFDTQSLTSTRIHVGAFKNQTLSLWNSHFSKENYTGRYYINYWLGDNNEFYIARSSRDLRRIDIIAVTIDGQVRTLVEERSNVYLD